MADFHKYKFYYAGNDKYEDGYDRIFKKKKVVKKKVKRVKKTRKHGVLKG